MGDYSIIEWIVDDIETQLYGATSESEADDIVKATKSTIDDIITQTNQEDMLEILSQFDISDTKVVWNGRFDWRDYSEENDGSFADGIIIVELKKTETYPRLEISDFHVENIRNMSYYDVPEIPDQDFRQEIWVELKVRGKDRIADAIRAMEKLSFVKSAKPAYIRDISD